MCIVQISKLLILHVIDHSLLMFFSLSYATLIIWYILCFGSLNFFWPEKSLEMMSIRTYSRLMHYE